MPDTITWEGTLKYTHQNLSLIRGSDSVRLDGAQASVFISTFPRDSHAHRWEPMNQHTLSFLPSPLVFHLHVPKCVSWNTNPLTCLMTNGSHSKSSWERLLPYLHLRDSQCCPDRPGPDFSQAWGIDTCCGTLLFELLTFCEKQNRAKSKNHCLAALLIMSWCELIELYNNRYCYY